MDSQIERLKTTIEFVDIPGAPLKASRVALGTWAMGGWMWGGTDEAESIRAIHEALDHGVTLSIPRQPTASAAPRRSLARRWPKADIAIAS
jgi:hypothetical protein